MISLADLERVFREQAARPDQGPVAFHSYLGLEPGAAHAFATAYCRDNFASVTTMMLADGYSLVEAIGFALVTHSERMLLLGIDIGRQCHARTIVPEEAEAGP